MTIQLVLIFLGIILIVVGYSGMKIKDLKNKPENQEQQEDLLNNVFKNAGIGSSEDILKQRSTYENMFEQKPGEIFDNIFQGKIIGLLSS